MFIYRIVFIFIQNMRHKFFARIICIFSGSKTRQWSKVYAVSDLKHVEIVVTYIHPQNIGYTCPVAGGCSHPNNIVVSPLKIHIMIAHQKIQDFIRVSPSIKNIPYDMKLIHSQNAYYISHCLDELLTDSTFYYRIDNRLVIMVLIFLIICMQQFIHGVIQIFRKAPSYP